MPKRIGVLTSGGDCPGLNAVLRGVVRAATNRAWEVIGFHDGFEGLLPPSTWEVLDIRRTAGIMQLGGTILGTTNKGHFIAKVGDGTRTHVPPAVLVQARETLGQLGIEGLIVIGGDGSLTTALQLGEAGIPVIGVPKTIDNDLEATAMTFGFDSAVACVADALDRLHTTASSHKRVMVIEVMGRHAGWIALYGGLAGGGDIILLPEIPFDHEKVAAAVRRRDAAACLSTLIVVAEGAREKEGRERIRATGSGEYKLGGIGDAVAQEVARRTGKETRTCVLGHLQRGGAPTTLDRILGTRFGVAAVELIAEGRFGHMVSYQNYQVLSVPIAEAVHRIKLVSPESQMVQTARAVGISFGD
ncbi:MAG: ATP-dependent phosphofructokinase / diphosphate-dependent phosphofructokinase [Chthoniobacter sp.]|jgi:6-phosphofructokinase 1|nr:ATP-dependent phosphofructokinase / diphosphate-dependent phosphofructokinase [Chthoniobacter sp.]